MKNNKLYIGCECGDPYHVVEFYYDKEERSLYITTMTNKPSFLRRLKEGIRHILGKRLVFSECITFGQVKEIARYLNKSLEEKGG